MQGAVHFPAWLTERGATTRGRWRAGLRAYRVAHDDDSHVAFLRVRPGHAKLARSRCGAKGGCARHICPEDADETSAEGNGSSPRGPSLARRTDSQTAAARSSSQGRASSSSSSTHANDPLGPPREAQYSKFPAKKQPGTSFRALALAPTPHAAAAPPRKRRTQPQPRTRSYFTTPVGRGVSPRRQPPEQTTSKVLCERPPSTSLSTAGRPVSSEGGMSGVVPVRRARSAELLSEWQPTALWQPKPMTPGGTGAAPFAAFSPPRSSTSSGSRGGAKLGVSFDRRASGDGAASPPPNARRDARRSVEKRQFDRQLDSLSAEIIATQSHSPVRALHRRWHRNAEATAPTDAELEAAALAEADAAGGAEAGEYSLRALLHEVGLVQHLPRLHAMQVTHEILLQTHSWVDLEKLGFSRGEAQRLLDALERARKRSVTQLLGSLTRQRVREGSAVRDAQVGMQPWRSPFEKKKTRQSSGSAPPPRLGPVEARPHSRAGLPTGGALPDHRDLVQGGNEALAVAGEILSKRSQLAAARDEQLQAELLEEGEILGWAPLSTMQSLGGAWTESRESLSRLEGRVTYSLGHTFVQAPLGEAPPA